MAVPILLTPLPIMLPANEIVKATDDGSSTSVPTSYITHRDGVPGSWLTNHDSYLGSK